MEEENNQPRFNEADAKMQRISSLQHSCNVSQLSGDNRLWYLSLTALFKEIYPKLNKDERNEIMRCISYIGKKLNDFASLKNAKEMGYTLSSGVEFSPAGEIFKLDCRIRELLDKYGFSK